MSLSSSTRASSLSRGFRARGKGAGQWAGHQGSCPLTIASGPAHPGLFCGLILKDTRPDPTVCYCSEPSLLPVVNHLGQVVPSHGVAFRPGELASFPVDGKIHKHFFERAGSFVCAHRAFTGDPGGHCFLDLGNKADFPSLASDPVLCLGAASPACPGVGWPMEILGEKKGWRWEGVVFALLPPSPCGHGLSL